MQYGDTHAYMVENRLAVHQPRKEPLQFAVGPDRSLQPTEREPDLIRDALAYALLPGFLYRERNYRLP